MDYKGITLRDYYAAAALTGCLSEGVFIRNIRECLELADSVFDMADAMLERRKSRQYKDCAEMEADKTGEA